MTHPSSHAQAGEELPHKLLREVRALAPLAAKPNEAWATDLCPAVERSR